MFQIITDSCCDLGFEGCQALGVRMIPFYVSPDGIENYLKEEQELPVRRLYEMMVEHPDQYPQTSLPSLDDYGTLFTEYARLDIPVLCLCFTSKMSGSYNSACNAKAIVQEEYPGASITVVDSLCATVTQALMLQQAVQMRDAGLTVADTAVRIRQLSRSARIFFTIGNMDYLIHGGRIGKAAGHAVNRMGLKPLILHVDGEVDFGGLAMGRLGSMKKVVAQAVSFLKNKAEFAAEQFEFMIGYGYDESEAQQLRQLLQTELWHAFQLKPNLPALQIGATIAVHTGPFALGVGILPKWQALQA